MSIIDQALKKAEEQKRQSPDFIKPAIENPAPSSSPVKRQIVRWGLMVTAAFILVLVSKPIFSPLFSLPSGKTPGGSDPSSSLQTASDKQSLPQESSAKKQFQIEQAPLSFSLPAFTQPMPDFKLTGTVYAPSEDSYCIINNQILKAGDSVREAKLIHISPHGVVLDHKGRRIVLRL
ncbi:MAG: general secretion pathway protein GspB [Candidatus Omnitrophica bacterium]|nr:general secretion pathway protein GspB [Candidatus Omnitrophota bacterium]